MWARRQAPAALLERRTLVDKEFIARGVQRCSKPRFLLWIVPWAALLVFGLYAACAWSKD